MLVRSYGTVLHHPENIHETTTYLALVAAGARAAARIFVQRRTKGEAVAQKVANLSKRGSDQNSSEIHTLSPPGPREVTGTVQILFASASSSQAAVTVGYTGVFLAVPANDVCPRLGLAHAYTLVLPSAHRRAGASFQVETSRRISSETLGFVTVARYQCRPAQSHVAGK